MAERLGDWNEVAASLERELAAERDDAARAALLFTCTGRGPNLFDRPHQDAETVADVLGDPPVAGMFSVGEIGPLAGRTHLHGYTASLALLTDA